MNSSPVAPLFGTAIYAHAADEAWTPVGSLIAPVLVIAAVVFAVGVIVAVLLRDTKGLPAGVRVLSAILGFFSFVVIGAVAVVLVALLVLLVFWLESQGIHLHYVPELVP
jgi:hypothetical protein